MTHRYSTNHWSYSRNH